MLFVLSYTITDIGAEMSFMRRVPRALATRSAAPSARTSQVGLPPLQQRGAGSR
jgi:hypothetical protein